MGKPFNNPCEQEPTAPPLTDIANESSYVDFIVLGNKENYSIRADRLSIINSSTELSRLVRANKLTINQANPNDFEALVRFIETKFIRFSDDNVKRTLSILELASTYQCHELEIACVKDVDLKLNVDNVIEVFRVVRIYSTKNIQDIKSTSKPTVAEEYLNSLLFNILQFIDQHADDILNREEMWSLRFEELEIVTKRENLQISTELTLFNLLAEWSRKECERKRLEPTAENRRQVLGGLIYTPRFLTLSYNEFSKCQERVSLLDEGEVQLIENFFNKKKNSQLNDEQNSLLENFRKLRPPFAELPVHLSTRSNHRNYPKKMRKYSQKMAAGDNDRGCCDKCLLNCITVFACIFE